MSHLVAALFENHAQAGAALQALVEMGLAHDQVTAIGLNDGREVSSISGFRELSARDDMAALGDLHLPAEDQRLFEQGLLSGHALIAARIDRDRLDRAVDVLGMFEPLDLDGGTKDRTRAQPEAPDADAHGSGPGAPMGAGLTAGAAADGLSNTGAVPGMGLMAESPDDLGTGELRADETAQPGTGFSSATATGQRRDDERADREGVNELAARSPAPAPDVGMLQRLTNRSGRVRAYGGDL